MFLTGNTKLTRALTRQPARTLAPRTPSSSVMGFSTLWHTWIFLAIQFSGIIFMIKNKHTADNAVTEAVRATRTRLSLCRYY